MGVRSLRSVRSARCDRWYSWCGGGTCGDVRTLAYFIRGCIPVALLNALALTPAVTLIIVVVPCKQDVGCRAQGPREERVRGRTS